MPDMPLSTMTGRFDVIFRLIGAGIIVVGIYLVLQPFLSALLVAGVLAIATWPLYRRIHDSLGGARDLVCRPDDAADPRARRHSDRLSRGRRGGPVAGAVRHGEDVVRRRPPRARTAEGASRSSANGSTTSSPLLVERQGPADRDRAEAARAGRQALGGHRAHARRRHPAVAAGHVHRVLLLPRRPSGRRRDRPHRRDASRAT